MGFWRRGRRGGHDARFDGSVPLLSLLGPRVRRDELTDEQLIAKTLDRARLWCRLQAIEDAVGAATAATPTREENGCRVIPFRRPAPAPPPRSA